MNLSIGVGITYQLLLSRYAIWSVVGSLQV